MCEGLTGAYWVRVLLPAVYDARRLMPRTRDRMELRRHALKLRHWPAAPGGLEHGDLLDLDWSWIRAMKGGAVGELRIDDTIGGCDNLRLIFYVHDKLRSGDPLPIVWILAAMQKKRDDFSTANIATFRGRRLLVLQRFYGD